MTQFTKNLMKLHDDLADAKSYFDGFKNNMKDAEDSSLCQICINQNTGMEIIWNQCLPHRPSAHRSTCQESETAAPADPKGRD